MNMWLDSSNPVMCLDWTAEMLNVRMGQDFRLTIMSVPAVKVYPLFHRVGTRALFRPVHESGHSLASNRDVKKTWSFTSGLIALLHGVVLMNWDSISLTFTCTNRSVWLLRESWFEHVSCYCASSHIKMPDRHSHRLYVGYCLEVNTYEHDNDANLWGDI
jgi:hypothetical protein